MAARKKLSDLEILELKRSDDYKDRMRAEYLELKDRVEKLDKLLSDHFAGKRKFSLNCPAELLTRQLDLMRSYLWVLEVRAKAEKIKL